MKITIKDRFCYLSFEFLSYSDPDTEVEVAFIGRRIGTKTTVTELVLEDSTPVRSCSLSFEARKSQWNLFAEEMAGNRSIEIIRFHSFHSQYLLTILPYFRKFLTNNPIVKVVDLEQSFAYGFHNVLGSIVCDKSSMAATYNSNHTTTFPGLMGIFRLNRHRNKKLVARKKVLMHHLLTEEQCKKSLFPVKAPVLMKYIEFTDRVIAENKEARTLITIIRPGEILFERIHETGDRLDKTLRLGFLYNVLKTQVDKVFNFGK
mmetsp:Transcript_28651/g.59431  ORF Transcript_28651/g.59431 Transcript_28651/m.59431 type:complete len:261 (+) Transcript_28651:281-1063(+)